MESHREVLRAERICLGAPGVELLDNVYVNVFVGEIVGLCGMEDSGKHEFVECINGIRQDFTGAIYLVENRFIPVSPVQTLRSGICVVSDQPVLIGAFSAMENLELLPRSLWDNNNRRLFRAKCRELLQILCPEVDPDVPVQDLEGYERVAIEIARAMLTHASLLVLDNVLSGFPDYILDWFAGIFEKLRNNGMGMLIVSSSIRVICRFADRIFVLRNGVNAGMVQREAAGSDVLLAMMTCDAAIQHTAHTARKRILSQTTEELLILDDVHLGKMLNGLSLHISKGEVLGVLNSNKNTGKYIVDILRDRVNIDSGAILFCGQDIIQRTIEERQQLGIFVAVGRNTSFRDMSLQDNIAISALRGDNVWRMLHKVPELRFEVSETLETFWPERFRREIPISNSEEEIFLSICRAVVAEAKLVIMRNASRGIDVLTKRDIMEAVGKLRARGIAVMFIDFDVDFLLGMCDRIAVVSEGKFVTEFHMDNPESRERCRQLSAHIFSL